ncbi:Monocarboxylate transporter 13 [Taenia solium]|eukprot:TsM_000788800 transcript=TsM_000788800 gene=TsM_000788800
MGLVSVYADVKVTVRHVSLQIGSEKKEETIRAIGTRVMSARNSSSFLQPPSPVGVAGTGTSSTVGGQMQGSQQAEQSSSGVVRLHSVVTRPSHVATASTSNIFRSLSTIHRSTSLLPASLLDLNVASTAGLQVIRPETHPEAFVPVPPDGGWGWLVVFAAFVTNLIIDGICVSFGIMVADLVEHFNASVATVMLMGSLLLGVYQIVGPVAAGLVNRFGCRAVGIGGSLLATVSMFVSAFMPTIELMLVSYGVFAVCGVWMGLAIAALTSLFPFVPQSGLTVGAAFGFLHLPSIICVSFYFDSRRALAIGMTSCGTPIGAMIFAPLTEVLLQVCLRRLHHQPCFLTLLHSSQHTFIPLGGVGVVVVVIVVVSVLSQGRWRRLPWFCYSMSQSEMQAALSRDAGIIGIKLANGWWGFIVPMVEGVCAFF